MTATDFMYDGLFLSDLGYIVCQFDESSGFSSSSAGSQLTFSTVSQMNGKKYFLAGSKYEECFETSISICKPDGKTFSPDEFEYIMRWLNQNDFHELMIRTDSWDEIRFNGTFNVDKVEFRGRIIGFNLHFISDSPFGRLPQEVSTFTIQNAGDSVTLYDKSGEIGHIYPDSLTIKCLADGELKINNALENRDTIVSGCSTNEVITFDGTVSYVESSTGRDVWNNFNFKFPRLANTMKSKENLWTFSMPCEVEMKYTPIKKVVF